MNQVVLGLSWGTIEPPFANASSAIDARASEWMTAPSTPSCPADHRAAGGRRRTADLHRGQRRPSRSRSAALAAAPADAALGRIVASGARRARGEVALPGELVLVGLEQRREADGTALGQHAQAG